MMTEPLTERRRKAFRHNADARTCQDCFHMLWPDSKIPANTYDRVTLRCNNCGGSTKWSRPPGDRERMLRAVNG